MKTPIQENLELSLDRQFVARAHEVQKKCWSLLQASSHQRKVACLKSFARYLQTKKILSEPVDTQIYSPKVAYKIPRYLTVDECLACLRLARSQMNECVTQVSPDSLRVQQTYQLFVVLYLLGLRISEALNLKWEDINWNEQTAQILGKGQKSRIVAVPQNMKALIFRLSDNSGEHVIPRPITSQKSYSLMRDLGAKAGLTKILNPHALRHSYATHLLSDGISLRVLQDLLGHSSLVATQKYTHLSLDHLAKVVDSQHPLSKLQS